MSDWSKYDKCTYISVNSKQLVAPVCNVLVKMTGNGTPVGYV